MAEPQIENDNGIKNEDIDSKIADFMADIDEIVLGKKSNDDEESEWKECFDETTQSIYYWNTNTNECSWNPPSIITQNSNSEHADGVLKKKRPQLTTIDKRSPKKLKKPSLIAEYTSTDSESSEEEEEENDVDIDELLNEVLEKEEKVKHIELYPSFEADCRAAIARLIQLDNKTTEMFTLRIQLETRLEDCLVGHLSKSYAVSKLEHALIQIDEFEKSQLNSSPSPVIAEPLKQPLTSSEMALLLSLPPPPPPPSPPPPNEDDKTMERFYAQLNCDPISSLSDVDRSSDATKSEHHHHHHHKDKKSKPAKTLPTGLIEKWTHARQELHGISDIDDS